MVLTKNVYVTDRLNKTYTYQNVKLIFLLLLLVRKRTNFFRNYCCRCFLACAAGTGYGGRAWGRLTRSGSFMQARDPWEKRYRGHCLHLIWVGF